MRRVVLSLLPIIIYVCSAPASAEGRKPAPRLSLAAVTQPLPTQTCGMTSIVLNSEEPTCNSHNGRWISTGETSAGAGPAYWTPTPLAHSTFIYYQGVVSIVDHGTYLITTEVPVASDCGVTLTARLKINSTIVDSQASPGGNRVLRHRFVYVKADPESATDEIRVEIEATTGGYAQGIVLDMQRTDVGN